MNEKEFRRHILDLVKGDELLSDWYAKNLDGEPLDKTVEIVNISVRKGLLTLDQAIILGLFIGLSTEFKK